MLPIISIVGRPNVGKSTLFNRLTKTRDALVMNIAGVTRDRQYGEGEFEGHSYILIDTGGIMGGELGLDKIAVAQTLQAISESNFVLFLVDARAGLNAADHAIADRLRKLNKDVYLVANKSDGIDTRTALTDFYSLGFKSLFSISASQGRGIQALMSTLLENLPAEGDDQDKQLLQKHPGIKVAVVGKPNVGKSTLVNRILGEERVVVFDQPGTTRDSIYIPLERNGKHYTLIDTAGVRRRSRVSETLEKFSIVKTLQAIESADVVILIIDAREGITEQDLTLLGFILETGKATIIAVNKWDNMHQEEKTQIKQALTRRLTFADFAKKHFISALHGTGVGELFSSIQEAYRSATTHVSTPQINKLLKQAMEEHAPPLIKGRRIKMRYAHMGGQNPPIVVIHGNQLDSLPDSYKRYLISYFRKELNLVATPIRITLKTTENPFKGQGNKLTAMQVKKRQRLRDRGK